MIRRAWAVAALAIAIAGVPASAATRTVTIKDFAFIDATITVTMGDRVEWHNAGATDHTSSGMRSLARWSFRLDPDDTRGRRFREAGTFPYLCTIHPDDMTGTVRVPIRATPEAGGTATIFTIRLATVDAPAGFMYQVQRKAPGGSFQPWKTTSSQTVSHQSTTAGTWRFRSRIKRLSNDAVSGWSPSDSVVIS